MPLNQKGARVFASGGEGYTELKMIKRKIGKKEREARKKAMENRKKHQVSPRAGAKLRSPRI